MNKHTPGPWEVYEQHHPYWDGNKHHTERWIMTGYDDPQLKGRYPIVALSAGVGLHGQKGYQFVHIKPENARLIAAAPDLLKALRSCMQLMNANCDHSIKSDAFIKASLAIAKATGETL